MCFSAGASFGTSVGLAGIGIAAIRKAGSEPQRLFAVIPLIFAVQQLEEGFVWLSFMHSSYSAWQLLSVYCYLFFAYAVWPVWVPLSILLLEPLEKRKKILRVLLITGAATAAYTTCCLLLYSVHAIIYNHHIVYTFDYSRVTSSLATLHDGFYFIATLPAAFISTRKRIWVFGILLTASYAISKIFFEDAVVSVWCYFSAALSIVVLFLIKRQQTPVQYFKKPEKAANQ